MPPNLRRRRGGRAWAAAVAVAALLAGAPGCSAPVDVVDAGNVDGLRTVAAAYAQAAAKTGRPPARPADLKPYLPAGADADRLLASGRDGQPLVILWGTDPRPGKAGPSPLVIGYEKAGTGGSRFVFLDMGVVSMTDADFAKANFPANHKPQ